MPETKKVTDFLRGIADPSLNAGLANVYGDVAKLQSFEACQQYLSTIVASTNVHKRNLQAARGVAGLGTGGNGREKKKPRLEARNYPLHQWKMFTPAEQKKIYLLRQQQKKTATKTSGGKPQDRNTSSLSGQDLQLPPLPNRDGTPPSGTPPEPAKGNKGGNAGNQFGRSAHGGADNRQ